MQLRQREKKKTLMKGSGRQRKKTAGGGEAVAGESHAIKIMEAR